jgi:SRSO17 transposase
LVQYLQGLFQEGKHNIERMVERIEASVYHQLHHFISESQWAHQPVLAAVGRDISTLLASKGGECGLTIDEEGHVKKGKESVGVARQYLGSIGKVDNGQVTVFAALNQADDVAMVNARLFLPAEWTTDKKRSEKAGVPEQARQYRSKWELALEMIHEMEGLVRYAWINADGFYGHAQGFRLGLLQRKKCFVVDIHQDQSLYESHPMPCLPEWSGKGRKPSRLASEQKPLTARELMGQLLTKDWKTYTFRAGTKGAMTRQLYRQPVYLWNPSSPDGKVVEHYTLLISRQTDGSEVKYALVNELEAPAHSRLSDPDLLYRQMNRYWVERSIQDCKDSLGMADYQVRSWRAFHHHITLTIMALHYMLIQKIKHQHTMPLLSIPDLKFALALTLPSKITDEQQLWQTIAHRHKQRQYDINRYKT